MAGLLARRAFTVTSLHQPYRFKSWCAKEQKNGEATVRQASQESVHKNYDLNNCQKTIFCPMTRQDCNKKPPPPASCAPKKRSGTDLLGKIVWIGIKGGIIFGLVYITVDAGLWRGSDETYELGKAMYKRIREFLGMDDSRMPMAAEVMYSTKQVWNKGVRIICNRIAYPTVDYETYMARLKTSRERQGYKQ